MRLTRVYLSENLIANISKDLHEKLLIQVNFHET